MERTAAEVEELARQQLELSEDEELPSAYLAALSDFLLRNPYDTNILGEQGGGHGFGSITCLEDFCWKDIMLEADPNPAREKGGKKDGWGSFFQFQEHCKELSHIKGRNQRLEQQGIVPELPSASPLVRSRPLPPASSPPSTARSGGSKAISLISALDGQAKSEPIAPASSASRPPASGSVKQELLSLLDGNTESNNFGRPSGHSQHRDQKPTIRSPLRGTGSSRDAIVIDDGDTTTPPSDWDGIEFLSEAPEGMRKTNNKHAPISLLEDSDSEDGHNSRPPTQRRGEMSFQEKKRHAQMENNFLNGILNGNGYLSPDMMDAIVERQDWLMDMVLLAGMPPYERPRPILMGLPGMSHFVAPWERAGMCPLASSFEADRATAAAEYQLELQARQAAEIRDNSMSLPSFADLTYDQRSQYVAQQLALNNGGLNSIGPLPPQSHSAWSPHHHAYSYPSIGMPGMPGAFPSPSAGPVPSGHALLQQSSSAASLGRGWELDAMDLGTEWDRPRDAQGLADFFKASMDDFQEDTTIEADLERLGLTDLNDKLPGMKITLMPHQVIGVAWMIKKEKPKRLPGGILGDEMGLGKTIQTIATIVANPSKDPRIKTTLVILPLALLRQWRLEIEQKSNLTVGIYHNSVEKPQSKGWFRQFDVVLTTLGTVTGERGGELDEKGAKKKKKRKTNRDGSVREDSFISDDEPDRPILKPKGILFKIEWYRIVLDEAAAIRNRTAKSSKAIMGLNGNIHWALTGTLVYNSLSDIYPLLCFTKASDWKDYNARISRLEKKKPKLASSRAQALLKPHLLRRTKQSTLNGQKLLNLPEKTVEMEYIQFSPEEEALYRSVETRARLRVNKWLKAGDNVKTWRCAFVLLTRLRQLCDHPFLLRAQAGQAGDAVLQVTDEELFGGLDSVHANDKDEVARAERMHGSDWVDAVRDMLKKRNEDAARQRGGVKKEEPAGPQDEVNLECPICYDFYADERITACKHSFCASCIEDVFQTAPRDLAMYSPEQLQRDVRTCPLCRKELAKNTIYRADAFVAEPEQEEEEKEELEDSKPDVSGKGKKRATSEDIKPEFGNSKRAKGKARASDDEDELDDEDRKPEFINGLEGIPPSSKLEKQVELIDEWYQADPSQKVLCFSSFVQYLTLVAAYLRTKSIGYELYTGEMKQEEREDTIKRFTNNEGPNAPRVMLISLKCGGVGLNLTRANLVICLDLAWSPASENQAIDRAHRIGQTRPVTVKRLIVRDSVEERMLALQERKQALADGAMGEGGGAKLGRMTLRDLISLFGHERDYEHE